MRRRTTSDFQIATLNVKKEVVRHLISMACDPFKDISGNARSLPRVFVPESAAALLKVERTYAAEVETARRKAEEEAKLEAPRGRAEEEARIPEEA